MMDNVEDKKESGEDKRESSSGIRVQEVLGVKRFKVGYEIRREIWTHGGLLEQEPTEIRAAYTTNGDYIGDPKWAHRLCVIRQVVPEKSNPGDCVCSIGYSRKDGKWYGWSHRAIYGFKVGSQIQRGNCGYKPSNKKEFLEDLRRWYENIMDYDEVKCKPQANGVLMIYTNKKSDVSGETLEKYPTTWGRGTWTAKTTADARQMAVDFADGVS